MLTQMDISVMIENFVVPPGGTAADLLNRYKLLNLQGHIFKYFKKRI